jgi:hypothetical protein
VGLLSGCFGKIAMIMMTAAALIAAATVNALPSWAAFRMR